MSQIVLGGLDIATTSGLAMMKDGVITTKTLRLSVPKKFLHNPKNKSLDGKAMGDVAVQFRDSLSQWIHENGIDRIAIEEPLNTNASVQRKKLVAVNPNANWAGKSLEHKLTGGVTRDTFIRLYGLCTIATEVCARFNIEVDFVNQTVWRSAFLGNGRPKDPKKAAKDMCDKLGISCSSMDAAEAAGVVWWLDSKLNPHGVKRANDLFASLQK